jgi:hypothetical protein
MTLQPGGRGGGRGRWTALRRLAAAGAGRQLLLLQRGRPGWRRGATARAAPNSVPRQQNAAAHRIGKHGAEAVGAAALQGVHSPWVKRVSNLAVHNKQKNAKKNLKKISKKFKKCKKKKMKWPSERVSML